MTQKLTVSLSATDTAAFYEVFKRASKLGITDFAEAMENRPVPKSVLDWVKGMGDIVQDKKALASSRKRRTTAQKRTAQEALMSNDKDQTNDFGLWYTHIKDNAARYFNDIVAGKAQDILKEPGKLAPWEKEEDLLKEIKNQLSQNTTPEAIMNQQLPEIDKLHRTIVDMKIKGLLMRMEMAAYYMVMHRLFVETNKITKAAFCKAMGHDPSTINKYLEVYTFLKAHNLLIYTGESFTVLWKWLKPLKQYLARSPQNALYWQGAGLDYTRHQSAPTQFNSTTQFQLGALAYSYSQQNTEQRSINEDLLLNQDVTEKMEGLDVEEGDPDRIFGRE